jgi:hypothetical protein
MPRKDRSVWLLSIETPPSSKHRSNACQFFSA